jgi:hypothetical protein
MWATPFALSKRSGMSTAPRAVISYDNFCVLEDQLWDEIPSDKRQTDYRTDEPFDVVAGDDPRWIAFKTELRRRSEIESDAECELASIVPITLAGIAALLNMQRNMKPAAQHGRLTLSIQTNQTSGLDAAGITSSTEIC